MSCPIPHLQAGLAIVSPSDGQLLGWLGPQWLKAAMEKAGLNEYQSATLEAVKFINQVHCVGLARLHVQHTVCLTVSLLCLRVNCCRRYRHAPQTHASAILKCSLKKLEAPHLKGTQPGFPILVDLLSGDLTIVPVHKVTAYPCLQPKRSSLV